MINLPIYNINTTLLKLIYIDILSIIILFNLFLILYYVIVCINKFNLLMKMQMNLILVLELIFHDPNEYVYYTLFVEENA